MNALTPVLLLCVTGLFLSEGRAASADNPMVHREGAQLVDGAGRPVQLRGVNLGGWLLWEGWMYGGGFTSESDILQRLNTLAGPEATQNFRREFYASFINAADLRKISELGFNSVRVPVNFRLLDNGPYKPVYGAAGWQLLDQLLDWCDQYHLYAIIDLHALPGGQTKLFTADPGAPGPSLWDSPENQRQAAAVWQAIAARYKSRKCIAGFDLINEPGAPKAAQLPAVYRLLAAAVRSEDKQHLIIIEGNKLATDFSMFDKPLDENMAYSFHMYTWFGDNRRKLLAGYTAFAKQQNIPLWCGEFGQNSQDMIGTTVKMYGETPEIHGWSFWPWKRAASKTPGLSQVKIPASWEKVIAWITNQRLHPQPTAEETRKGMAEFLDAVKLQNAQPDPQMVRSLLPD